jgi:hypothetical protein
MFTLGGRNATGGGHTARQSRSQSIRGGASAVGVIVAVGILRFNLNGIVTGRAPIELR